MAIASVVAGACVAEAAGRLTQVQIAVLVLTLEFVVQPVSTLMHELGHAAVARRVTTGPVTLVVGRGPYLRFSIDRIRVNFGFLPMGGVLIRGLCRSDLSGVSWRNRARLALAGPTATFLELYVAAAIGASLWGHVGALARNVIGITLVGLVMSLVFNLVPRNSGPIPNDGAQALAALKNDRAHTALPVATPRSTSTRPGTGKSSIRPATKPHMPVSAEVAAYAAEASSAPDVPVIDPEQDLKRSRTSIPPPGMD